MTNFTNVYESSRTSPNIHDFVEGRLEPKLESLKGFLILYRETSRNCLSALTQVASESLKSSYNSWKRCISLSSHVPFDSFKETKAQFLPILEDMTTTYHR